MTGPADLILLALGLPLLGALLVWLVGRAPDVRETVSILTATALAVVSWLVVLRTARGDILTVTLAHPLPEAPIAFTVEPLGALFGALAATLWVANAFYAIGYMRAVGGPNQTRFHACFALALFAVTGVAYAANLFTLFVFYEILSLVTWPLVAHLGDEPSRKAGRMYSRLLVATSAGLFLAGVVGVQALAGTTTFQPGGVLAGKADDWAAGGLLLLFAFGVSNAALLPVDAVVKAGVFTLLKISAFIFGSALLDSLPAAMWLSLLAAATIVIASLVALAQDTLKARLAWSTIAQLAYVSCGAFLGSSSALLGGSLQILAHAVGKITLFMCAGAIYVATGRTRISQMRGLGRRMPIVFTAFLIGSLSVSGLPPMIGMWPKFELVMGALDAGRPLEAFVMVASSGLTLAYTLPIALIAFLPPEADQPPTPFRRPGGAPPFALAPLALTAAACIVLFFAIDWVRAPLARTMGVTP